MKEPRPPRLERRRASDFSAELLQRARAWVPSWDLEGGDRDFGRALLETAARFSSEVAERLDNVGDKMRRGFLDWLGVRGEAARPSRMPVVFKLADSARESVFASTPVRMQADAGGTPVFFETEQDLRIVPGRLDMVVGVDADKDEFYLSPPRLSDLTPPEPVPTQWTLKSYASAGSTKLQLDPPSGLAQDMIIRANGRDYRITNVENGIVTIEPGIENELLESTIARKVETFAPFDKGAINRQEHALYLGHMELLNIEAAATIEILGASSLRSGVTWQYWGKIEGNDESDWRPFKVASTQQTNNAVQLEKPKGSIDPREINGKTSRWIRAFAKTVSPSAEPFTADELSLRINALGCSSPPPCPPTVATVSPAAEAMANTTPLVLDKTFFPLGKEPRLFDAFYLGSREALSKKGATVQLCFELADPSFLSLSPLRQGIVKDLVVAGVGRDRALHILTCLNGVVSPALGRDPLQPPVPSPFGVAPTGNVVPLDREVSWRLPFWSGPSLINPNAGLFIAVTAGDSVWVWHENSNPAFTGWLPFGQLDPDTQTPSRPIDGLVFMDVAKKMAALRAGVIYLRNWPTDTKWDPLDTQFGGNPVRWKVIAPINIDDGSNGLTTSNELLGISETGKLFRITTTGTLTQLLNTKTFLPIAPVALLNESTGETTFVAVEAGTPPKLVASQSGINRLVPLPSNSALIGGLELTFDGGQLMVLACVQTVDQPPSFVTWTPFDPVRPAELFATSFPEEGGRPSGTPTRVLNFVLVPTTSASVLSAPFTLNKRQTLSTVWRTAVVTRDEEDQIVMNDYLAIPNATAWPTHRLEKVTAPGVQHAGKMLHEFAFESVKDKVFVYHDAATALTGHVNNTTLNKMTVDLADTGSQLNTILLITTDLSTPAIYKIRNFNTTTRVATLDRNLNFNTAPTTPTTVLYKVPAASSPALRPLLRLSGASANWDARVLDRTKLLFPGANPRFQSGEAFRVDAASHPELVVLGEHWITSPPMTTSGAQFLVDGSLGDFTAQLGDTSNNPELSWEYSNGKGWGGLDIETETTRYLKTTGVVRFKIPSDIAESDWAGKTNFWIRARLVGGDYGKEKVTVTSTTSGNTTTQTVDRSTAGIRAPSVVKLHISYSLCEGVLPTFVLVQDSGSFLDQSDANNTAGAQVEAFVPLALLLGRLAYGSSPVSLSKDCPPACRCHPGQETSPGTTAATTFQSAKGIQSVGGRALFIGLDATLSGAPINVLVIVEEERPHGGFVPLRTEAFTVDSFIPIVADDRTRALGESGVLSMTFATAPTRRELFGKALTWLQLTPKAGTDSTKWMPSLRGAYLNAVWASATETLTRELVGSSDGSPNLTMRLARPPALHGTLELRVKEPLGDEERVALRKDDARRVLSDAQDLPGDWVLWKQVTDPGDEPATERVYTFDEATGEIRFGNGQHGMIPPIGRDSIVAFSYQRTEPPKPGSDTVPGNLIAPRTALNLVSPVEGVEAVTAGDQAAGGAPPEPDDRVLRFGLSRLRHRNRAVTPQDLEDLALQSSPDIAQARCFVRRGFIRLVIVLRGKNPIPNAAQIRELHRLLTAVAPPALSEKKALQIVEPSLRRLRVQLTLRVELLEHAGALSEEVKRRFMALFDTTTGGSDGDGWALGVNPNEEDVALALIDAKHLESLIQVKFLEIADDGVERTWPAALKPVELVVLDTDPVRIEFVTAGVMV